MNSQGRRTRPLPPRWNKIRRAVLVRDGHTCQIAGQRCTLSATEVDHIVAAVDGGNDSMSNLQAVCSTCHASKTAREANAHRPRYSRLLPEEPHPGLMQGGEGPPSGL